MAEIEPASDELVAAIKATADDHFDVHPGAVEAILARLRKAEADLARLREAIAEAEKHGPEVVHFIRAMATQGGGNG